MSTPERQYVSLENLGNGAAAEKFADELQKVIANISDPNTKAETKRSVTLKMSIKPSKNRDICTVEISCDGKLAPVAPFETSMFVGMENGVGVASEYRPEQGELFVDNDEGEKVNVVTGQVVQMMGRG